MLMSFSTLKVAVSRLRQFLLAPSSTAGRVRSCWWPRARAALEPRPVKLGRRGDGRVEIVEGLTAGEEVVTLVTFLIDAESNLQTALKAFTQPEPAK